MDQVALPVEGRGEDAVGTSQVLQRVLTDRPAALRPLYWRIGRQEAQGSGPVDATLSDAPGEGGSISLTPGTTLFFDTYFGSFFESHWRLNTRMRRLSLSVRVSGPCLVRVKRRAVGVDQVLGEARTESGTRTLGFVIPDISMNFREYGLLFFEVTALGPGASFREAAWMGTGPAAPVALGVVFCTFNRERFIAGVLAVMVDDPAVLARLDRVVVVNQGRPGLRQHPEIAPLAARLGNRLTIIEQGNFGGAGGFTRGLLATLEDPSLTHCALLDDDIRLEPDTILRLIAFLSLAGEVAVGGQMLDGVQPMRLYENGAVIDSRDWFPKPAQHNLDLTDPNGLDVLAQPQPVHFNGWWCFAVSLDIVRRMGLPLPCFIRGDDAEYGMRLYRSGIPTVVLPGAAVWHEPFYLKLGNWQLYYETRNLLVLAALHDRFSPMAALRRAGRNWLIHLLTFRYYGAALILRGVADFLQGPEVLRQDPQALHRAVVELRTPYGPTQVGRRHVVEKGVVTPMPRRRLGFLLLFTIVLLRNALLPTARSSPVMVRQQEFSWVGLRRIDRYVLDNWWEPQLSSYRRDRGTFWALVRQALPVMARLLSHGGRVAASWQAASSELTSARFWNGYLGRAEVVADPAIVGRRPSMAAAGGAVAQGAVADRAGPEASLA